MSDTFAKANTALEGRPPLAILRGAVEHFAPRLTLATAFNPEDNVLLDTIARHQLPIDVFTIDTGLLFDETRELWRGLEERYGVSLEDDPDDSGRRRFGPRSGDHGSTTTVVGRVLDGEGRPLAVARVPLATALG